MYNSYIILYIEHVENNNYQNKTNYLNKSVEKRVNHIKNSVFI